LKLLEDRELALHAALQDAHRVNALRVFAWFCEALV
jgi:hypothetical protein